MTLLQYDNAEDPTRAARYLGILLLVLLVMFAYRETRRWLRGRRENQCNKS